MQTVGLIHNKSVDFREAPLYCITRQEFQGVMQESASNLSRVQKDLCLVLRDRTDSELRVRSSCGESYSFRLALELYPGIAQAS
jgi:hypothetical protein